MAVIYTIGLALYYLLVRVVGIFSQRARLFIQSRQAPPLINGSDKALPNLWIHCASHGEYETAKPLITRYQSQFNIHLTFYSPSGYRVAVDESHYWTTLRYLAFDHSRKLQTQIQEIDPDFVIFIQYEYWYYLLKYLSDRSTPYLYYGVQLDRQHLLTRPYGRFLKDAVNRAQLILTRDSESQTLGSELFTTQVNEVGDVRWLQAAATRSEPYQCAYDITRYEQIIVLGSVWLADMQLWTSYIHKHPKTLFIIAPHDISDQNVSQISRLLPTPPDIWLDRRGEMLNELTSNLLIVNTLGQLKYLYRLADLTYIGERKQHPILQPN